MKRAFTFSNVFFETQNLTFAFKLARKAILIYEAFLYEWLFINGVLIVMTSSLIFEKLEFVFLFMGSPFFAHTKHTKNNDATNQNAVGRIEKVLHGKKEIWEHSIDLQAKRQGMTFSKSMHLYWCQFFVHFWFSYLFFSIPLSVIPTVEQPVSSLERIIHKRRTRTFITIHSLAV